MIRDMAFEDILKQIHERPAECKVAFLVNQMPDEDRDAAEAAMALGSGYSGATIARAITAVTSSKISASAVNIHRNGDCPCHSRTR